MWFVIKHEDRIIIKLSSKVNSLAFLQASTSTITTNCTNDDSADCAQYSKELEVLVCHDKSHEKTMEKKHLSEPANIEARGRHRAEQTFNTDCV